MNSVVVSRAADWRLSHSVIANWSLGNIIIMNVRILTLPSLLAASHTQENTSKLNNNILGVRVGFSKSMMIGCRQSSSAVSNILTR